MSTKHIPKFTSERSVVRKTCPSTITLTFPPLIYTAIFLNLLFNDIKNEILIHFLKYCRVFEILYMFSKVHVSNVFMQSNIIM